MINSTQATTNNSSSSIGSYLLFPAFSVLGSAKDLSKRAKLSGNKVLDQFKQETQNMKNFAKNQGGDIFTSSIKASEQAKIIVENSNTLNRKVGILDIIKCKFNKEKAEEALSSAQTTAKTNLENAKNTMKNMTENSAKQSCKLLSKETASGFLENFKSEFKGQIKGALVFEALFALPEIINNVIPTFKEKGIIEGLKETGKLLIKHVPSAFAFTAGGTAGKLIGGAIGSLFGGPLLGGNIGSMIGGMITSGITQKITDKIIGEDDTTTQENNVQEANQTSNTDIETTTSSDLKAVKQTAATDTVKVGRATLKKPITMKEYMREKRGYLA